MLIRLMDLEVLANMCLCTCNMFLFDVIQRIQHADDEWNGGQTEGKRHHQLRNVSNADQRAYTVTQAERRPPA